jgi:hypothetical protein
LDFLANVGTRGLRTWFGRCCCFCVFRELSKSRTLLAISLEQIKHGAGNLHSGREKTVKVLIFYRKQEHANIYIVMD